RRAPPRFPLGGEPLSLAKRLNDILVPEGKIQRDRNQGWLASPFEATCCTLTSRNSSGYLLTNYSKPSSIHKLLLDRTAGYRMLLPSGARLRRTPGFMPDLGTKSLASSPMFFNFIVARSSENKIPRPCSFRIP